MRFDIVRAWKDDAYRQSLNEEQRRMLPANPVGELELTDADLEFVEGAQKGQPSTDSYISDCGGGGAGFSSMALDCSTNISSITSNNGNFLSPTNINC